MLESKLLRGNIDFVVEQLKRRNFSFDVDEFNELENQRKMIQVQTQELQHIRNTKSKSCLLYTSPTPREATLSRMPSSA